jgi:hypothetical protein
MNPRPEEVVATETKVLVKERDLLVSCVAEAYEALHLIPGVDENGPVLVWLSEHLLHAHRRSDKPV